MDLIKYMVAQNIATKVLEEIGKREFTTEHQCNTEGFREAIVEIVINEMGKVQKGIDPDKLKDDTNICECENLHHCEDDDWMMKL